MNLKFATVVLFKFKVYYIKFMQYGNDPLRPTIPMSPYPPDGWFLQQPLQAQLPYAMEYEERIQLRQSSTSTSLSQLARIPITYSHSISKSRSLLPFLSESTSFILLLAMYLEVLPKSQMTSEDLALALLK